MRRVTSEFINADGFVTIKPNANPFPGEGNGWLQTGLAHACGMYDFPPAGLNVTSFVDMLNASRKSPICPLIWRSPHKKNPDDDQKCDDYWGALLLNEKWASEVLDWALRNEWNFDVREIGGIEYRFDRFPGFEPILRMAAGESLSLWDEVYLAGVILFDSFKIEAADGNMKAYCRLRLAEMHSSLCAAAAKVWRWRIKKRYGRIGASWEAYFGEGHPLNYFDE